MITEKNYGENFESMAHLITLRELNMMFDCAVQHLCETLNDDAWCGYGMPSEFYSGISQGTDFLFTSVIHEYFDRHDWEDVITFDQIMQSLCLDKTPKNPKELFEMVSELRVIRSYHQALHRHSIFIKNGEKENPNSKNYYEIENLADFLNGIKEVENKYGIEKLHINDFFEFGVLYGKLVSVDWGFYIFFDELNS